MRTQGERGSGCMRRGGRMSGSRGLYHRVSLLGSCTGLPGMVPADSLPITSVTFWDRCIAVARLNLA